MAAIYAEERGEEDKVLKLSKEWLSDLAKSFWILFSLMYE